MSTPFIPPQYVPAPMPPAPPPLLPDANGQNVTSNDAPYTDKQALDLEMRKNYPELWRAVRALSRENKATAREQAAGSLAEAPKMVQQPREPADRLEWIDLALPFSTDPRVANGMKRSAGCNRTDDVFPPPECGDRYFDQYQALQAEIAPALSYDLIGGGDPHCTCIRQLPEFIACSAQYLEYTDYAPFNWPKQILDYRGLDWLWSKTSISGLCSLWRMDCPEPATGDEAIYEQIDETLKANPATRVYLNQTQLDGYLAWRKLNGTMVGFHYIRVTDKAPAPDAAPPGPKPDYSFVPWIALSLGGAAGIGLGIWAKLKEAYRRAALRNIVASTSAPPHSAPTVRVASPSSMGSVSTTVPDLHAHVTPSTASGRPVGTADAAQSSSSSSDTADDSILDMPPAGREYDA